MKYYRVHSEDIAYLTQQPRGIFTAIYKLVEAKILSEDEEKEYWRNREYFEKELPVPPFYENGNPQNAITWFKDTVDGNRIYQEMEFYRNMASKYGLKLLMIECEEIPGDIIYEDDYQIAVINQKKDLKTRYGTRHRSLQSVPSATGTSVKTPDTNTAVFGGAYIKQQPGICVPGCCCLKI